MIIANFSDKKYATASGLWQWDYGQVLRIQGLSLPTAVEIHFSLQEKGGEATTRIGTTKDGVTDVVIPDSMLENGGTSADYAVYAFVYLTDDNSGETEYKIKMPVRTRPKPEGFTGSSDTSMAAIIKTVNEIADDKVSVPSVAKVGQVIAVKAVDESGKPTEFEVVDQGGGVSDEKIVEALESYMEANPQKDVSYEPQELTNEQKTQARTNIGAASFGGYTAGKNVVTDASGNIATEEKPKIPYKTSDLQNDSGYLTEHQDLSGYATKNEIPKTASEVGADASGTAESKVSEHNVATDAHNDIRLLIEGLTTRLNALADSDDTTLDQMSEVVAYIKSNKSLIDAITTSKVNVSDIIDNLTTNVSNKPLSASQGVALKALIDAILPKVTTEDNGKFLRVSDGAWTSVALTDVSEVGA